MDREETGNTPNTPPIDSTPQNTAEESMYSQTAPAPEVETTEPKRSLLFFAGVAAVILAVAGVAAYQYFGNNATTSQASFASVLTEAEAAEPVAYVNGTAITRGTLRENLDQITQGALQSGADPTDLVVRAQIEEQAYTITVNNELLRQAATQEVDKPTEEEVQAEIDALAEQNGGQEAFDALLVEIGFTEEMLRQNIADNMHIQAYLQLKQSPVTVTDEEIVAFYDSIGGEAAGLPALEEVRDQIEAELESQKLEAQISEIIETLRETATIEQA